MTETLRAGEVSERLGIPPSTLRLYSVRFARWLSAGAAEPGASGGRRGHRSYTEEDVALLVRVKDLFARGRTVSEVEAALGPPSGGVSQRPEGRVPAADVRQLPRPSTLPPAPVAAPREVRPEPPEPELPEVPQRPAEPSQAAPPPSAAPEDGRGLAPERHDQAEQVVALALRALAEAQQSEAVWRGLLERRQREVEWLRSEVLRQEVDLARLVMRLNDRMRVVLRRVEQIAEPVRLVAEEQAARDAGDRRRGGGR